DEAIVAYEKVIKNTRDVELEAKANFNIGNSLYRQGKLKEALDMYKRTVELTDELVTSNSSETEANKLREDAKFNHEFVEKKIEEMQKEQKDRQEKQEEDKQKEDKEKKEQSEGDGQKQQDQDQGEEKQQEDGEKDEQGNGQEKEQDQQPTDTQNKIKEQRETGMTEEEASRLLDAIQQNEKNSKINLQLEHTKGAYIDKDW
ncbi:MAG: tetratricopeptide repeat protein, partial [Candidatus Anammoxibacter sp.]